MKYAVVTGATKGIGKAIAEALLERGYYVIVNYATDDNGAKCFAEDNKKYKGQFELVKISIESYENACLFSDTIKKISKKLDVLVLNSGTTDISSFDEISIENWNRVLNVNLTAPFFVMQQLSKAITDNDGRIILIGSSLGKYPHARSVSYGVSKAAVNNLATEMTKFFCDRGITINAIAPGFVDTPWQSGKAPEHRKRIEDKIALHRFADPKEIASLAMEIINNQYINGAIIDINGGYDYR